MLNATNHIKVVACYSNASALGRPWRKANNIIYVSAAAGWAVWAGGWVGGWVCEHGVPCASCALVLSPPLAPLAAHSPRPRTHPPTHPPQKDKRCTVKIAASAPVGSGTVVWRPTEQATASYRILVLEVLNTTGMTTASGDPPPTTYTTTGGSAGYFYIEPTENRPAWLVATVSVCITIGPITLITFFLVEAKMKKNK